MTPKAGPMESIGSQESSDDWKRNSYLDVFLNGSSKNMVIWVL